MTSKYTQYLTLIAEAANEHSGSHHLKGILNSMKTQIENDNTLTRDEITDLHNNISSLIRRSEDNVFDDSRKDEKASRTFKGNSRRSSRISPTLKVNQNFKSSTSPSRRRSPSPGYKRESSSSSSSSSSSGRMRHHSPSSRRPRSRSPVISPKVKLNVHSSRKESGVTNLRLSPNTREREPKERLNLENIKTVGSRGHRKNVETLPDGKYTRVVSPSYMKQESEGFTLPTSHRRTRSPSYRNRSPSYRNRSPSPSRRKSHRPPNLTPSPEIRETSPSRRHSDWSSFLKSDIQDEDVCKYSGERANISVKAPSPYKRTGSTTEIANKWLEIFRPVYTQKIFYKRNFVNELSRYLHVDGENDFLLTILLDTFQIPENVLPEYFCKIANRYVEKCKHFNELTHQNALKCLCYMLSYYYVYIPGLFIKSRLNHISLRSLIKNCNMYCLMIRLDDEELYQLVTYLQKDGKTNITELEYDEVYRIKNINKRNEVLYRILITSH